jgi:TatD DNase family protein
MDLFDTHTHLDDEQFDAQLDAVLDRAQQAGVCGLVAVGTTAAASEKCVGLARRYAMIYAAVGIQPNCGALAAAGDWERIVELAGAAKVVALGETGLDRYWDHTPWATQQELFERHLRLSQQTDLPVIIHMRDCGAELLSMLRDARARGPLTGVMHSFTGDAATAAECLVLGLHISFSGMITFPKSAGLRDIARCIPADRILIETDAPYLSPHPHRGQRPNEPARIIHTARCLAEARGVALETFAAQTTDTARRLFRLERNT